MLKNELLTKPVYLIAIVIGMFISPLAMALGMLAASVYCCVVAVILIRKTIGYSVKEQLMDIIKPLAVSVVMFGVVTLIGFLGIPVPIRLAVQLASGIGVYLGVSIATKDPSYCALRGLFLEKAGSKVGKL